MRIQKTTFTAAMLIVILLAACVPAATSTISPTSTTATLALTNTPGASPAPSASPTPTTPAESRPVLSTSHVPRLVVSPAPNLDALVEQAKSDLAARLNIEAASIQVIEAQSVEWPDGSLGCPKPGFMYNQMVAPGALIRLEYTGVVYEYHSGNNLAPFYCQIPRVANP